MKRSWAGCLLSVILPLWLFLIASVSAAGTLNSYGVASDNPYVVSRFVQDGVMIDKVIVPGRPPEFYRAPEAIIPMSSAAAGTNTLSNVPAFDWCYGCSATSAAMMFGYYDNTGYPNLYAGPANGGACPMTNAVWGKEECPLSATHQGLDGRTIKGHVDDYWVSYDSTASDPYIGHWTEHVQGECTGDFMGTNQSAKSNTDGSTNFFWYTDGSPTDDFTGTEPGERDGCHGMKLFFESRGYTTVRNYNQYILGYEGNTKGFTYSQYKQEIDAGRPVLIQVEGHTMLGYGYNDSGSTIYLHDTWDYQSHSMSWGGSYSGMQHYGVTVFVPTSAPTATPTPTPTPTLILAVSPSNRNVRITAGTTSFVISNTGTGTMQWTAAVTSGSNWLTIVSGASGTNSGTITCAYTANTAATSRTGTIRVTASGATGSPRDVTVVQSPSTTPTPTPIPTPTLTPTPTPSPILAVSPSSRNVGITAGMTTFSVSNTGTGTMQWTATVTSGGSWLSITSGASGTNSGTITCAFTANTASTSRTGTIQVTAAGAAGSPKNVTVVQSPSITPTPTPMPTPTPIAKSLVPETGQTKCYDVSGNVITCPSPGQALYGQDANYTINPRSYTKLDGNGNALPDSATSWVMVKDKVTGLIWETKTNKDGVKNYEDPHDADNTYTWYDSNPATNGGYAGNPGYGTDTEDFIKALNDAYYGGYSDWRMPTAKELAYIVDYSISDPEPKTNKVYFPNTVSDAYWSSTTYTSNANSAWGMNFGSDYYDYKDKSGSYYVRAVRGGQLGAFGDLFNNKSYNISGNYDLDEMASAGSFTDNGDGTLTDVSTGLMWQQNSPTGTMTWEAALAYCEILNLGGYTDWRLPSKSELQSLVDYSRFEPAINTAYFPNTVSGFYQQFPEAC